MQLPWHCYCQATCKIIKGAIWVMIPQATVSETVIARGKSKVQLLFQRQTQSCTSGIITRIARMWQSRVENEPDYSDHFSGTFSDSLGQ